MAGDRYERQADAVAQAVLRGESAQPLLDQGVAGPVQVHAAPAGAAAPVQMMKRGDRRRPHDVSRDGSPASEEEGLELADLAEQPDLQPPPGGGAVPQQAAAALHELEQLTQQLTAIAGEPAQQQAAGGDVISQQTGAGTGAGNQGSDQSPGTTGCASTCRAAFSAARRSRNASPAELGDSGADIAGND